jgi:hypothetical protein
MTQEKVKWATTCNRFVAFLDIMGFRDMIYRENHQAIYDKLTSLSSVIKMIDDLSKTKIRNQSLLNIKPLIFSDSIILISKDNIGKSAIGMMASVGLILYRALSQKIPIKGVIAYGRQTADFEKSIYFGKPIIDAFELQNEIQIYGVVLHHSVENQLNKINVMNSFTKSTLLKYPVPIKKSGNISHYIFDWTQFKAEDDEKCLDMITRIYSNVSGSPRLYVDNTIKFLEWLKKEKDKQDKK